MKNKLIFLLYLLPAIAIIVYFSINNQVLIQVTSNHEGVEYLVNRQAIRCEKLTCEIQVPRSLKMLKYNKDNFLAGSIKIDTYKNKEYQFELIKVAHVSKVEINKSEILSPFLLEIKNNKLVLFSNQENPFPLASFPGIKNNPDLYYSTNLNYVLLVDKLENHKYLFDTKNNQTQKLDDVNGQDFIVLNDGGLIYRKENGVLVRTDSKFNEIDYYNLASLNHIVQAFDDSLMIISKDINSVFTDQEGVNFAYEVSKSFLSSQDSKPYSLFLIKENSKPNELINLSNLNENIGFVRDLKANNKIYLESSEGIFEIKL